MDSNILIIIAVAAAIFMLSRRSSNTGGSTLQKLIVCIGDSLTSHTNAAICPADKLWPALLTAKTGYKVINSGVSGNTSQQMLDRFDKDVIAHKPTHCIIECGGNDAFNWDTGTMDRIRKMIELCRANNITPVIMACTPQHYSAEFVAANQANPNFIGKNPNWEAAEYLPATRSAQEEFCRQNGIAFENPVPVMTGPDGKNNLAYYHTDKCHANEAGNEMLCQLAASAING